MPFASPDALFNINAFLPRDVTVVLSNGKLLTYSVLRGGLCLAGRKPRVRIVASLAYDDVRQNRHRTTLSHEYGHVHFHRSLFDMAPSAADLFEPQNAKGAEQICKRQSIMNARKTDWMEWQAGYVCGALLMPISRLRKVVGGFQQTHEVFGALGVTTARSTEPSAPHVSSCATIGRGAAYLNAAYRVSNTS